MSKPKTRHNNLPYPTKERVPRTVVEYLTTESTKTSEPLAALVGRILDENMDVLTKDVEKFSEALTPIHIYRSQKLERRLEKLSQEKKLTKAELVRLMLIKYVFIKTNKVGVV